VHNYQKEYNIIKIRQNINNEITNKDKSKTNNNTIVISENIKTKILIRLVIGDEDLPKVFLTHLNKKLNIDILYYIVIRCCQG
jgi:hypothetical protein